MTHIDALNAVAGSPAENAHDEEGAAARPAAPLGESKHDHLAEHEAEAENRQEALIDEGVEETFPASDPATPKRIT
ncbi:hypothetical protein IP78_04780 [Brevundimonas sp. AAP58]|uniref:hypothetical protein n=1 Tax=Brevundimonas sp. AAP58 TaxID=1523422 RepID=UPI0006B8D4EC|nr:hypothetical protein [Brevundimonas sp. AAP58]KPF81776.1 hypothetical protein IP78_04780 [Brevundimonas sp. AAP58]